MVIFTEFINNSFDTTNSTILTNTFIEKNIDLALNDWHNCPWNKIASEDIILNYLLPYQLYNENPYNWRDYFFEKYKSIKDSFATTKTLDTRKIFDRIINKDLNQWFRYSPDFLPNDSSYNFKELIKRKKGDCVSVAYMCAYALRSVGVAASIDFVPFWGCSLNAGHAEVVFMDSTGKMVTYDENRLNRSAKVLRYTFKKQNKWTDSIKPIIGSYKFLLENLVNDHWFDVTNEHNTICNINYSLSPNLHIPFAYICAYNYGNWQPIFYGPINNNVAKFSNMGCNIFYQVAVPDGEGYKLIDRPFIVNDSGKMLYLNPDFSHKINMKLHQTNGGYLSYIKQDEQCKLYMLDKENKLQFLNNCIGLHDSTILVKNIPANAMYKLVNINSSKRLERPFSYKNNNQIWW